MGRVFLHERGVISIDASLSLRTQLKVRINYTGKRSLLPCMLSIDHVFKKSK